jgi:AP-2 complex subunit alpha
MPPFPPRESALLSRLNRKHGDTEDKRTWIIGGKDANLDREASRHKSGTDANEVATNGVKSNQDDMDIMSSLAGLDLSSTAVSTSEQRPNIDTSNSASITAKSLTAASVLRGPNVDRWFEKLCHSNEGVLYEDIQIQMGIKSEYHGHMGRVAIYFGNKVAAPLTSFTATLSVSDPEALSVSFAKIPPNTVNPRAQTQQLLHVECKKAFTASPILTVSFLAGSHQSLAVRLPIVITKFFEPVPLGPVDFFERWKLIGGPPREAQQIFPIDLDGAGHIDIGQNKKVVTGHRFGLLDEVDPNPVNLVGAGVLHTSEAGKVGCLLRVEPNREAKVSPLRS